MMGDGLVLDVDILEAELLDIPVNTVKENI